MENVGDDAKSVFHEDQKFFNGLQKDLKIFKSDTFESYKSYVS